MILILAIDNDPTVDQVEEKLLRRGARYLRFHNDRFPVDARVSFACSDGWPPSGAMEFAGARYDLDGFSAIWERRNWIVPVLGPRLDSQMVPARIARGMTRRFVSHESSHFIEDIWQTLECRWLPGPTATVRRIEDKVTQTKVAHELGFDLPPALITNDPREFLDFYREHNGRIVGKVFHRKLLERETVDDQHVYRVFTEIVSSRAAAYASGIRYCPVIFQAYVPKRSELRVTVVAGRVFAAEIFSQENHRTRHDWRRYYPGHTTYRPHRLPADLERRCAALLERVGLSFGAIDLVLTPDGRYVFLEIKPRGEWQWIESATGLPISDAVCDYLMNGATHAN